LRRRHLVHGMMFGPMFERAEAPEIRLTNMFPLSVHGGSRDVTQNVDHETPLVSRARS
jgi:hypothetical protein